MALKRCGARYVDCVEFVSGNLIWYGGTVCAVVGVRARSVITDARATALRPDVPVLFGRAENEALLLTGGLMLLTTLDAKTIRLLVTELKEYAPEATLDAPDEASRAQLNKIVKDRYCFLEGVGVYEPERSVVN